MKIPNKAIIKIEYNDEIREYVFDINELNNIIKEKQTRIDKAIKYIENLETPEETLSYDIIGYEKNDLLDILKGSNSNE